MMNSLFSPPLRASKPFLSFFSFFSKSLEEHCKLTETPPPPPPPPPLFSSPFERARSQNRCFCKISPPSFPLSFFFSSLRGIFPSSRGTSLPPPSFCTDKELEESVSFLCPSSFFLIFLTTGRQFKVSLPFAPFPPPFLGPFSCLFSPPVFFRKSGQFGQRG